jgi:hypothetical protein
MCTAIKKFLQTLCKYDQISFQCASPVTVHITGTWVCLKHAHIHLEYATQTVQETNAHTSIHRTESAVDTCIDTHIHTHTHAYRW